MSRRRVLKATLVGLGILLAYLGLDAVTVYIHYKRLQKSLHTDENPLTFMVRSVMPGMTHAEVHKIIRGYSRRWPSSPDHFSSGGEEVYEYATWFPGLWIEHGEYATIHVDYDAEGRVKAIRLEPGD